MDDVAFDSPILFRLILSHLGIGTAGLEWVQDRHQSVAQGAPSPWRAYEANVLRIAQSPSNGKGRYILSARSRLLDPI